MSTVRCLLVKPSEGASICFAPETWEGLAKALGGTIGVKHISPELIIVHRKDEEAKKLRVGRVLVEAEMKPGAMKGTGHVIFGNFFLMYKGPAGLDDMSDENVAKLARVFADPNRPVYWPIKM